MKVVGVNDNSKANYKDGSCENNSDLKSEMMELKNKVGYLTGRILSMHLELCRERVNIKHLYQHLGIKLGDEEGDIEEDEEGVWVKI